jgi:hypothetical protein
MTKGSDFYSRPIHEVRPYCDPHHFYLGRQKRKLAMLEIIALFVLVGKIGSMARSRHRSPLLFGLLLLVCWFGGEAAGAAIGYLQSGTAQTGMPNILKIYGLALAGAAVGAGVAFLAVQLSGPVDRMWREPTELPGRRSRLWGAVAGGVAGGLIGAILVAVMYGQIQVEDRMPMVVESSLVVGSIGALLGLVSGVQKKVSGGPNQPLQM